MSGNAQIQFAICNEIFQGWEIEKAMVSAAEIGYDAIEIAPFTLADSVAEIGGQRRREIREAAQRAGIAVAGIHWVLVKPEGLYINHTDSGVRARTARYFSDLVDFCADLGGRVMVVGSPKQRQILPGVSAQQAWDWARETFQSPVRRAEERGVTICLEPLSPQETNFINTAEEAVRFTQTFGSPRFQIILDVKAMSSEGKPLPAIIAATAPHFAHFHANDPNLKGPGFGEVDFVPIAQALARAEYRGYVSVEVFRFEEGAETIARRSLACLRTAFGSGGSLQTRQAAEPAK